MIIPNGRLQVKSKQAGGIDPDTGYPIKATETWGDPLPAQIIPNRSSLLGVTAGCAGEPFSVAEYTVLMDKETYPTAPFEQVRLTREDGTEIGSFSVQKTEYLQAVSQWSITL